MRTRATLVVFIAVIAMSCNGGSAPSVKIDTGSPDVAIDGNGDVCTPSCGDKECGDDACGGTCGACNGMLEQCSDAGQCEPFPCESSLDCPGTLVCNKDAGECVICAGDEDCLPGEICGADFECHITLGCTSDLDCKKHDMVCDKDIGLCVECLSLVDCEDAEYCFENYCLEDVCIAGQAECDGQDVLLCEDDGSAKEISETCGEAQYCEDGACHDQVCPPGEVYCDGNDLNTCDDIGKEILNTVDCEDDDLFCYDGACVEQECQPDSSWCTDNFTAAVCAEDGMSSTIAPCPAEFYCEDGTCEPWVCDPASLFCVGEVYKVCNGKGSAILYEGDCAENDLFCFNGACIDTVCPPGQDFCSDGIIQALCADDGSGITTEACPAQHYCSESEGVVDCLPWACIPGTTFCEDNIAKVCNSVGSDVTNQVACGAKACVAGECKPVICLADTSFCVGLTVMQCDATGTASQEVEACGAGEYCGEDGDTATCLDQICTPDVMFCQGTKVVLCNTMGSETIEVMDCSAAEQGCQDGECVEQVCGNGATDPGEECDDGTQAPCDGCEDCQARHLLDLTDPAARACTGLNTPSMSTWTVEAWVYLDQLPDQNGAAHVFGRTTSLPAVAESHITQAIYVKWTDAGPGTQEAYRFRGKYEDSNDIDNFFATSTVVETGKWYHVAYSRLPDGSQKMFVDGALAGSLGSGALPASEPAVTCIGAYEASVQYGSTLGYVDEVRVSDVARYSASFVPARRHTTDEHTVALWHFDEGEGATATDSSANGYDITLQQGASWEPDDCYGSSPDSAICGDGQQAVWEECDDGNNEDGDGCDSTCLSEGPCLGDWLVGTPCNGINYGNGCVPSDTGYHFKGVFNGYACWWHHKNQAWNTTSESNYYHLALYFELDPWSGKVDFCYDKGSTPTPLTYGTDYSGYFSADNVGAFGWCAENNPNNVGFVCFLQAGAQPCP